MAFCLPFLNGPPHLCPETMTKTEAASSKENCPGWISDNAMKKFTRKDFR